MKRTTALTALILAAAGTCLFGVSNATAATDTWKVYVDGTLVNSSAAPTTNYEAPHKNFSPGQSVTMHVTTCRTSRSP